jgi:hypothetical protein
VTDPYFINQIRIVKNISVQCANERLSRVLAISYVDIKRLGLIKINWQLNKDVVSV